MSLYNCPIDKARQYTSLWINFSTSGRFTEAKHDLYKIGLKPFLKFIFKGHKPKNKTLLHIFDHTVKPILSCGSEIWNTSDSKKLIEKGDCYFEKLCKELQTESVYLKLCKFSLGVGKRSTNMAVIGELGRYPLFIEVIVNMVSYLSRLTNTEDKLLAKYLDIGLSQVFNMKSKLKRFIS